MSAHDNLLERCAVLVPALQARAAEAERLRRLPDATIADAAAAGLFSMLVSEAQRARLRAAADRHAVSRARCA